MAQVSYRKRKSAAEERMTKSTGTANGYGGSLYEGVTGWIVGLSKAIYSGA